MVNLKAILFYITAQYISAAVHVCSVVMAAKDVGLSPEKHFNACTFRNEPFKKNNVKNALKNYIY